MIRTAQTLLFNLRNECITLLLLILAFFTPIIPIIMVVGICILADTIFGVYKAYKLNIKISSRKLSQLVSKMVLYQSAIVLSFVIEKFIMFDFILAFTSIPLFITKIVALILVSIEIKSLDETYKDLYGKSMWTIFKELLARVKELKESVEEIKK